MLKKPIILVLTISGGILLLVWIFMGIISKAPEDEVEADISNVVESVYHEFGINADSFRYETVKIRSNQFLADLLLPRGVDYPTIDLIARRSKEIFDVTRIKAGNFFHFYFDQDDNDKLRHMIYEVDKTSYVHYSLGDSLIIAKGEKEVTVRRDLVNGSVESSLWNAMIDNGISTNLALKLNDIYAWVINFFAIQKGDEFEAIYENRYIDTTYIGIGKIFAARMNHGNRDHYAFLFEQNGVESYYDEDGNSLRRSFLKAPLDFRRISSGYSNRRYHPVLHIYRPHRGVDYAADRGTPVWSIGDGTVSSVAYDRASGHYIKIRHNRTYTSGYLHLRSRPKFNVGDRVKQKEVIGYVGSTGLATGPHLDFRIWKNGSLINPATVEAPPVEPVNPELRPRFDSIVKHYMQLLNPPEEIIFPEV
jgi:murein DD-endopeptidase MepM/ murein hydrolase activator NlpD